MTRGMLPDIVYMRGISLGLLLGMIKAYWPSVASFILPRNFKQQFNFYTKLMYRNYQSSVWREYSFPKASALILVFSIILQIAGRLHRYSKPESRSRRRALWLLGTRSKQRSSIALTCSSLVLGDEGSYSNQLVKQIRSYLCKRSNDPFAFDTYNYNKPIDS